MVSMIRLIIVLQNEIQEFFMPNALQQITQEIIQERKGTRDDENFYYIKFRPVQR